MSTSTTSLLKQAIEYAQGDYANALALLEAWGRETLRGKRVYPQAVSAARVLRDRGAMVGIVPGRRVTMGARGFVEVTLG